MLSQFLVIALSLASVSALSLGNKGREAHLQYEAQMQNLEHQKFQAVVEKKKAQSKTRIERLEPWEDSGQQVKGLNTADEMFEFTKGITNVSYEFLLRDFTASSETESRYVGNPGNHKAAVYLKKKLEELIGGVVEEHPLNLDANQYLKIPRSALISSAIMKSGNIVALKKGTDLVNEVIVVGAHYDSVNWAESSFKSMRTNINTIAAPGVDDNGSGVAAMLSVAQALSGLTTRRSVLFVAFNAEEEGLLGSESFVRDIADSCKYGCVKAAFIADEVAFPGRPQAQMKNRVIFETVGNVDGTQAMLDTMGNQLNDPMGKVRGVEVNKHGFGSDHMSFLDHKIPAVLLIERDDEWHADAVGHSKKDTFQDLDMNFGASVSRLLARSVLKFANPSSEEELSPGEIRPLGRFGQ